MAAGTLFGIGLSQQMDLNGKPMPGCRLFLYQANTTTPVTAYKNVGLTAGQEHPNPIIGDANGRIPAFWLDASLNYRARLTNAAGVVQFDEANIMPIGAVSGGGGGGDTTDPNSVNSTGDVKWRPMQGTVAGWVRMNGRSISDALQGGTEMADANCLNLFTFIWQNITQPSGNQICPVLQSGAITALGSDAPHDWAAGKEITLPDMRGRSPFGLDAMGNAAISRIAADQITPGGGVDFPGSSGGKNKHQLAVAELPVITPTGIVSKPNITAKMRGMVATSSSAAAHFVVPSAEANAADDITAAVLSATPTFTGDSFGGNGLHNNMAEFILGTWYMRL